LAGYTHCGMQEDFHIRIKVNTKQTTEMKYVKDWKWVKIGFSSCKQQIHVTRTTDLSYNANSENLLKEVSLKVMRKLLSNLVSLTKTC
jgi:hypothetical protein